MDNKLQRYEFFHENMDLEEHMYHQDDGRWVKHEDIQTLEAENAHLKEDVNVLNEHCAKLTGLVSKWVSVEDEWPLDSGHYPALSSEGEVDILFFSTGKQDFYDHEFMGYVTHWMPLPEPPAKGEGDDIHDTE